MMKTGRCVQSNERLLKLYESGLPAWAIYMPLYRLPYRPWMRTVCHSFMHSLITRLPRFAGQVRCSRHPMAALHSALSWDCKVCAGAPCNLSCDTAGNSECRCMREY